MPAMTAVRAIPLISPGISASYSCAAATCRHRVIEDHGGNAGVQGDLGADGLEGVHEPDGPRVLDRQGDDRRAGHHALGERGSILRVEETAGLGVDEGELGLVVGGQVLEIQSEHLTVVGP